MADDIQSADQNAQSGNPGQAAGEQTQPRINLDDLPEFRAWKSNADRRIAEANREAERARLEAQQAIAAQQAVYEALGSEDRETAQAIERRARERAETEAMRARLAQLEQVEQQQAQYQSFVDGWHDVARDMGVNPYDNRLQAAINQAWQTGKRTPVSNLLGELVLETKAPQQRQPEQPRRGDRVMPLPDGGTPVSSSAQALYEQAIRDEQEIIRARGDAKASKMADFVQKYGVRSAAALRP